MSRTDNTITDPGTLKWLEWIEKEGGIEARQSAEKDYEIAKRFLEEAPKIERLGAFGVPTVVNNDAPNWFIKWVGIPPFSTNKEAAKFLEKAPEDET